MIEAITRPVPPSSAEDMEWILGEEKIMGPSEDESKTVLPPPLENAWSRVDLLRALFEAPTNVCDVQKSLIADNHSVSKPVQSKSAPRDEVTDEDETEEVNPVPDEPVDELETVIESNEDEIDDGNLVSSGGNTCPEPQRAPLKH